MFQVLYIDVDTVLLRDPFPHLQGDFDLWIQSDALTLKGDPWKSVSYMLAF